MNLTDIDVTKATPIDFDDIREGDTILIAWDHSARVFEVSRKSANVLENASTQLQPRNEDGGSWFLLDRPSPPSPEPGTTGTATVRGVPGVRVVRAVGWPDYWYAIDATDPDTSRVLHPDDTVTDFVADPAPGIPQALRNTLEALDRYIRDGAPTADVIDEVYRVVGAYREARDV